MRKLPARKLLGAIIAGALFLPETAYTLGLGEIEVSSALNQKLKADIELLSASPEDAESIIVKLASRKEFSRAGLDRPYQLNDLRFKADIIDDVPHIIVTSGSPIREPFLNFLVEIDWPNGHLLREYTVLLDPPVFMTQAASPAPAVQSGGTDNTSFRPASGGSTNVVPVAAPGVTTSPRPGSSSTAPVQQPQPQPITQTYNPAPYVPQQTTINQPPGSYRIKTGDTAWSLANAMMPDQSITVEQMMIAMLRANPESFIDENINGLKRGYILRVPDYDRIVAIDPEEARALVREQAAMWRQYQQTHAGGQPASALSTDEMGGAAGMGDGTVQTSADDAYLEIVSAGSGTSTMSGKDPTDMSSQELRAELALARERVETERVEKEALQQRIEQLEQYAGSTKGMLSIEDDAMSDVQALGAAEGEPTEAELLESDIVKEAETEMAESIAETEDLLAEQNLDDAISQEAVSEEGAADASAEESAEEAVFLDETSAADGEAEMPAEAEPVQEEAAAEEVASPKIVPSPQIVTRPPADPLSQLLSDPILLAAAGGGLLLIIAVIALIIKRRKGAAETEAPVASAFDDFESLADEVAKDKAADAGEDEVEPLADETIVAGTDEPVNDDFSADSTMILEAAEDTVIAEESPATMDDEEPRDDVIAEADVYLAYGIYQQAEELLTQAITDNPERDDYRVKLAETHYASKNAEAFVEIAAEIKKRAGDEATPEWKKIMVMGQDLCADNPLFQGSMVGGLDVDALAPKAPEMDFDLGIDAAESAGEIEFDLSDAGAVEETPAKEDEFSLDIEASELDIDIQDEAEEPSPDEVHDIGDVDIDFGLDDDVTDSSDEEVAIDLTDEVESLDLDLDDEPSAGELTMDEPSVDESPAEEPVAIDIADEVESLDLDLDDEPSAGELTMDEPSVDESPAEEPVAIDIADDDDFDLSSLDDVDEISTKLDLARAYLDMGDNEGTRGILEEVIAEGNDEQKQEANELMAKLG